MIAMKHWLFGEALALFLGLAGCGNGVTATVPSAAATSVPTSASTATIASPTMVATAGTATGVPSTTTRTAGATPTHGATPGAGATGTRVGTARATASPGRLPTATDEGIKTVAIRLGQSAVLPEEGLTLDFTEVINDSRCPRSSGGVSVACAWAGEATITIGATRGGESSKLTLVMPGLTDNAAQRPDYPKNSVIFAGYKIQLASLEPQPTVDGSKPGEYTVTLLVSKVV